MTDRERLAEASLEGCYLETLLAVAEDAFEEIDTLCDSLPTNIAALIRPIARKGLNIAYMAQDKAAAVKSLADAVERELWLAEHNRRLTNAEAVQ